MIYDCFLYNGEKDLLKIRCQELHLLHDEVRHIAVESKYTFTGKEKPFSMTLADIDNYGINWVPLNEHPNDDPWFNEMRQRNAIKDALIEDGVKDDDIIIISDVDEIPRTYAIQHYRPEFGLVALQMDIYHYFLNTRGEYQQWRLPRIMPWSYLKDRAVEQVRSEGFNFALINAGWHYTYLGGVDAMLKKFASFSHQEEAVQRYAKQSLLEDKINRLEYLWDNRTLEIVHPDELPYYVRTNRNQFEHLLCSRTA